MSSTHGTILEVCIFAMWAGYLFGLLGYKTAVVALLGLIGAAVAHIIKSGVNDDG